MDTLLKLADQIGRQMAHEELGLEKSASMADEARAAATLLYGLGQFPGYYLGKADGKDMRSRGESYPRVTAKSALGMLLPGGFGYAVGKRVGHAEPPKRGRS